MTLKEFLAERGSIYKAAAQYPRCEDTFTKDVEHNYETILRIIEVQDAMFFAIQEFDPSTKEGLYLRHMAVSARAQVDELIKDKE